MTDKPKLFPLASAESDDAREKYSEMEIDTLSRTLWGEARNQGSAGMQAVACVIINRVRTARHFGGYWWGNDIREVCHKPYQFSCWNKNDPNLQKLIAVSEEDIHFVTAKRVARRAVLGFLDDQTYGADHYHARHVSPVWAKGKRPTNIIGQHVFYRLVEVQI
jgi:spore germination cell wall hydrolase CwlJ-like protein